MWRNHPPGTRYLIRGAKVPISLDPEHLVKLIFCFYFSVGLSSYVALIRSVEVAFGKKTLPQLSVLTLSVSRVSSFVLLQGEQALSNWVALPTCTVPKRTLGDGSGWLLTVLAGCSVL